MKILIDAKKKYQLGLSDGARVALFFLVSVFTVLVSTGCGLFKLPGDPSPPSNTVVVTQTVTVGNPSPTPSPSPGTGGCEVGKIVPGTQEDVREIAQGATLPIGVSLFGLQGIEFQEGHPCLGQHTPAWSGGTPCLITGEGYDVSLSAPESAALDAVCEPKVTVGGKSGSLRIRVVAGS